MMIYNGEALADWETELLSSALIEHEQPIPETVRKPLFIEQVIEE